MKDKIIELHDAAMAYADEALLAKLNNNNDKANSLMLQAYESEKAAAELIFPMLEVEPSRSILHRSAASLGIKCGKFREAEKLIMRALYGDPPIEIAEELRDLYEQINFERHLETRGLTLGANEFQFSIAGLAVGPGIANVTYFIERVKKVERMICRTSERLLKLPFQERGRPKKYLKGELDVYVKVPEAASFAVAFKIGASTQSKLPGIDLAETTIDELFNCVELSKEPDLETLKNHIGDDSYFRNFVGLAKSIAPDGENIKVVGFTSVKDGKPRNVSLTVTKKPESIIGKRGKRIKEIVKVQGTLKLADKLQEQDTHIQIVDADGVKHKILVPAGIMNDIVKPMWDCFVVVTGTKKGKVLLLEDIEKIGE